MAKNINNLDKSLKQNITPADIGAATASSVTTVSNNIGALSNLKTSEKGSLVEAINELFQSANNGKQLIANAIGEPLSSSDTFSAMSDDINSLLNTFKTNMTNYGVDVEESDKFKQLIDRIGSLAQNEGKGIKYASRNGTISELPYKSSGYQTYVINTNLDFTPTVLFWTVESLDYEGEYGTKIGWELYETANSLINVSSSTCLSCILSDMAYDCDFYLSNVNSKSFTLHYKIQLVSNSGAWIENVVYRWYAIGEKTTTQISNKTDGFNIEVASSLPEVVIQDRVCIVEPNDNVNVYMGYDSRTDAVNLYSFNTDEIYVYMTNETAQNTHTINLNRGNVKFKYNIGGAFKYNGSGLALCEQVYKGDNNQWVRLWNQFNVFGGGKYYNNMSLQSTKSSKISASISNKKIMVNMTTVKADSSSVYSLYSPVINLSNFDKLYLTISDVSYGSMGYNNTSQEILRFGVASGDPASSHPDSFAKYKTITQSTLSTMNTNSSQTLTLIIDVSTLSGNHFIKINKKTAFYMTGSFCMSDIYFTML